MPALRWSRNPSPYTADKPEAVRGQYRIWQDPGNFFRVLHVSRISKTGELSECPIGETDTLDNAKAIAQAHADQYGRKKPAAAA
jgi:hypothetical protein